VTAQKHKSSASNNNPQKKTQERDNMNKSHWQNNSVNNAMVVKLIER
jgi:hypothetical protein